MSREEKILLNYWDILGIKYELYGYGYGNDRYEAWVDGALAFRSHDREGCYAHILNEVEEILK